jgi:hypothetical protein
MSAHGSSGTGAHVPKSTFGSGHVGRIRAASAGRRRPDQVDSPVEGDAVTYHAVRMESSTARWASAGVRQRPASALR